MKWRIQAHLIKTGDDRKEEEKKVGHREERKRAQDSFLQGGRRVGRRAERRAVEEAEKLKTTQCPLLCAPRPLIQLDSVLANSSTVLL